MAQPSISTYKIAIKACTPKDHKVKISGIIRRCALCLSPVVGTRRSGRSSTVPCGLAGSGVVRLNRVERQGTSHQGPHSLVCGDACNAAGKLSCAFQKQSWSGVGQGAVPSEVIDVVVCSTTVLCGHIKGFVGWIHDRQGRDGVKSEIIAPFEGECYRSRPIPLTNAVEVEIALKHL